MLADGRVVRASADENPDLFWAIRGGGGNFGIATSLEYALHQVGPMITGGVVAHPLARGVRRAALLPRHLRDAAGRDDAGRRPADGAGRLEREAGRHRRRPLRTLEQGEAAVQADQGVRPAGAGRDRADSVLRASTACSIRRSRKGRSTTGSRSS